MAGGAFWNRALSYSGLGGSFNECSRPVVVRRGQPVRYPLILADVDGGMRRLRHKPCEATCLVDLGRLSSSALPTGQHGRFLRRFWNDKSTDCYRF